MSVHTDSGLADVVRDRLRFAVESAGMLPDRITIHAHDGCIELKGAVPSWKDHEMLEQIALRTPGVSKVDNQLALLVKARLAEPPSQTRANDSSRSAVVERRSFANARSLI